jgi:Methyltransferase domain
MCRKRIHLDKLARYLQHGHRIDGWLDRYSAVFIADLCRYQSVHGIFGSVAEIGVHMGRLFLLLNLAKLPDEKSLAIDVFDDQHLNVDKSGYSSREKFLSNVAKWCGDQNIEIIQKSSLHLSVREILDRVGPCRIISIDGGHTEECVMNDLQLAEGILLDEGVVVLDDFFHQEWPGVASGGSRHMLDPAMALRPFCITPNKLYLSKSVYHDFYRSHFAIAHRDKFEKTVSIFGCETDVYGCSDQRYTFRSRMKEMIKASPFGPFSIKISRAIRSL